MRRKLLTLLVSACALAAGMVGPAAASAATLTITDGLGDPAASANFESSSTRVSTSLGYYDCEEFILRTDITQNAADPVTLQLTTTPGLPFVASVDGCQTTSGVSIEYSNIQLTDAMEFAADGTGSLPLRFTETWNGTYTCVRQGVLDLAYTASQPDWGVTFGGALTKVSGSSVCPSVAVWSGSFDRPTDAMGDPVDWVVTP